MRRVWLGFRLFGCGASHSVVTGCWNKVVQYSWHIRAHIQGLHDCFIRQIQSIRQLIVLDIPFNLCILHRLPPLPFCIGICSHLAVILLGAAYSWHHPAHYWLSPWDDLELWTLVLNRVLRAWRSLMSMSTVLNFNEGSRGGRPYWAYGLTPTLRASESIVPYTCGFAW